VERVLGCGVVDVADSIDGELEVVVGIVAA